MRLHPQQEEFSAYLDNHLDVRRTHEVAFHLAQCAACRAEYQGLESAKLAVSGMSPPAAPPPQFWADAYRRLRVEGDATRRRTFKEVWQETWRTSERRWAGGVAAAAVLTAALAAPLLHSAPVNIAPPAQVQTMDDTVDVSSLIRAHTDSAARQPLADADRQRMLSVEADDITADTSNN